MKLDKILLVIISEISEISEIRGRFQRVSSSFLYLEFKLIMQQLWYMSKYARLTKKGLHYKTPVEFIKHKYGNNKIIIKLLRY